MGKKQAGKKMFGGNQSSTEFIPTECLNSRHRKSSITAINNHLS
jgi:hypothetical protein